MNVQDLGTLRLVTARQLAVGDLLTATNLVVVGVPDNLSRATGFVDIETMTPRGMRVPQKFGANARVNVVRDYHDPTNNPYYWALEAERERQEDARDA